MVYEESVCYREGVIDGQKRVGWKEKKRNRNGLDRGIAIIV